MEGLTNKQQAIVLLISALLISIATVQYPVTENIYVTLILSICGAVGFALKEWAGGKPS